MRVTKIATLALFVALASVPLASDVLAATSASTTFTVSANVIKNCTISAANMAFGAYDPVVANAAVPLDITSTVSVACTKGASATVGLDAGLFAASAVGTTRAMSTGGAGATFLSYEIYKDAGHAAVWGNSGAGLVAYTAANKNVFVLTDYGRIPAGQDQPVGSYLDTVTATINF